MSKNVDFFTLKYILHFKIYHPSKSFSENTDFKGKYSLSFLRGREETAQCRETVHLTWVFNCSVNRVMEDWYALLHTASRRCCEGACAWLQGEALGILSPFLPLSLVISAEHPLFLREGRRWEGLSIKIPPRGCSDGSSVTTTGCRSWGPGWISSPQW